MAGQGLILDSCILHITGEEENPILLTVSNTKSSDDPQIEERLYAGGDVRGIVGFRDTRPFVITIEDMNQETLDRLLRASGKTAVYRPDSNLGVWDVIIGRIPFDQIPKSVGENFKVRVTLHRGITR